ncbi:PREDICTED: ovostatin homolog 1 [Rhinopithecus bieti]|uniref:ovostatin homolog 1 n=1 Tax=Rhinopithecus bieti TaxID=61621 RepID=UPI00083C6105|nr:PREDICTED: ovostatin homolog 1 [Rhinopithecus bieti]
MVATFLLSTFLLHFTAAVASEPQYILWVSSVIQSDSAGKACLHLLRLNESVSLSVVLEYDGSNTTIFDQFVEEDNFYACADFKVSQKSSEQLAFITLLAKGATHQISERRSVAVIAEEKATFIQTDKPIYKSGEKVQFRIVTLDTKFKAVEDLYPLIIVQDPQNNRIFQWQNVTSFRNITQLSFQLISEPMFGDYWIVVKKNSGKTVTHQFAVKRYVLPKFEVTVSAPETVTISDDEFQVDVCAKYTFGQPVQGKTQIQVCREYFSSSNCEKNDNEICEQFIAQLENGCVSQIVNTKVFQLYRSGLFMTFHVAVIVTEFGTGVQIGENTSVFITQLLGTVNFENMDTFYRRGISYFGTLKFSGPDNVPMVNKLLQLELNDEFIGNYTTDENGEAQFSIDTSDIFDPEFNLKATYVRPKSCYLPSWLTPQYSDASFLVSRFYSRTNSFLKIVPEPKQLECNQQKVVTVLYSLNSEAYEDDSNVKFFYLMMVKGAILLSGQKEIRNKAWNGNFSFAINVSADLAPVAVLFVYTLHPSGEIVADSVRFQIDKCFKHKVNIKFSEEQGLPGSNASLYLQAAPDSFCALRAVDRSVLLLKSEQQLSAESVYNMVPSIELYGYFYRGLHLDDSKEDPCIPQRDMFYNGLYYTPVSNYGDGDIYNIVMNMGLKVFTNLHYRKPEVCVMERGRSLSKPLYVGTEHYGLMLNAPSRIASGEIREENADYVEQAIIQTVRTNFPETWIWDLVSVDSSGSANLSFLIPDTITQWEASGFCVNGDVGFGVSSTTTLEVSQPFFIEIASPFSVVQNEQFDLIVNVFNYLDTCVEISVQVEESQNYEANINTLKINGSEIIQTGGRKTNVWTIIPKKLGKVNITVVAEAKQSNACPNEGMERQKLNWKDTVVKSFLVEPEGIEKERTQSFLICTEGAKASKQGVLDLPNDVVEGSARGFFTVVGDILGLAMQNLVVLQMPYGSGEQNAALLASDTYVLDYLKSTEQLTEEVQSKAFFLLSNGYQRQLSFKNSDGSYSVFWQQNQKGSIWLSALTFKTLERMKNYVFIDENVQKQTLIWLSSQQKMNGCFKNDGQLFNHAWEGGDEEDISLTAYVVGMFFEAGLNFTFPALRSALFCLEEALDSGVTNGYNHAILAYTFALAGEEQKVESLLQTLDQSATKINNVIYWERERKPQTEEFPSFTPWAPSAETEKTCYVLLAVISRKIPDLTYASKIVQWLAQQMNSHGGFSSTQATPVCLLAITCYMKLTFSKNQNTVTFSSEGSSKTFRVNSDNRLLVQHSELTKAPGEYTVDVEGHGCTFIQATLKYNVLLPKKASGFSLSLEIVKNSSDIFQTIFELTVTLKYTGIHNKSSIVVTDVKMLSGFTPAMSSIEELENKGQVMKTEVKNGHVLFYLENVFWYSLQFHFSVEQSNLVFNIQPAPVMVYDYYEKEEYALAFYNIDSSSVSE